MLAAPMAGITGVSHMSHMQSSMLRIVQDYQILEAGPQDENVHSAIQAPRAGIQLIPQIALTIEN